MSNEVLTKYTNNHENEKILYSVTIKDGLFASRFRSSCE